MNYYGYECIRETDISHHGIKGQRWGVINGPPYPLKKNSYSDYELAYKNIKHGRVTNLDKWGKDAEHNVLFIAGYSGSGKSTTALGLKKPGDTVIHLDGYTEKNPAMGSIRNKKFSSYLDKKVPGWHWLRDAEKGQDFKGVKRHSQEYWNIVDRFLQAIEDYSKLEYKAGHRVIVEGVQIADDWLAPNKSYYADKPLAILQTGALKSLNRAFIRDDRGNILTEFGSLDSAKEYVHWYAQTNKKLRELSKEANTKKGRAYVDALFV